MMSKSKKRIMFLALEMDLGGLQRIVNLIIERIDKAEFVPYLCCLDRGGCFAEEVRSHVEKMFIFRRKPGPMDFGLSIKLYSLLRENKIDIIHSQNACISYAVLAGRLARVRGIVHTDHGRLVPDKTSAVIEDRVSSLFVDRFVGVSEELTAYLRNRVGISPKKLMTIINGVDSDTFLPGNLDQKVRVRTSLGLGWDDKILGTVCRLDPIKNLELLIDAFRGVVKTVPESRLLIVGDGPNKKRLMEYAGDLERERKIQFLGRVGEIERILQAMDLYVNTSLSEGTSMTILEAMSCGLPVVASSVGGNPKLVDSSNGALFPQGDGDDLQRIITDLLRDDSLRTMLGTKSREKIEGVFSIAKTVTHYEEVYRSLYEENKN